MKWADALEQLKAGKRVAHADWHGEWLVLVPASTITVEAHRPLGIAAPELVGQTVRYQPHIDLYIGGTLAPWPYDHADAADDGWQVVSAPVPPTVPPSEQDPHA